MSLKLHQAASVQALTTAEAKLHLRVDHSEEDALIDMMVKASTLDAEHLMQRAVMPQKWKLSIDEFPSCAAYRRDALGNAIDLCMPPVTAVDSLIYLDSTGANVTLATTEYQVVIGSDNIGRIVPAFGKSWPAARYQPEAVQVIFSTGYANAAAVPEAIKTWIALRLGALYENRSAWTQGGAISQNEFVDRLLDRYRTITL